MSEGRGGRSWAPYVALIAVAGFIGYELWKSFSSSTAGKVLGAAADVGGAVAGVVITAADQALGFPGHMWNAINTGILGNGGPRVWQPNPIYTPENFAKAKLPVKPEYGTSTTVAQGVATWALALTMNLKGTAATTKDIQNFAAKIGMAQAFPNMRDALIAASPTANMQGSDAGARLYWTAKYLWLDASAYVKGPSLDLTCARMVAWIWQQIFGFPTNVGTKAPFTR